MTQSVIEKERAAESARKLTREASLMVVQLGQERLKALQTAGIALDARCTQVAAIQLAAAAFAGGITGAEHASTSTLVLAALGCLSFVFGSAVAIWGIRACPQHVAGIDPAWWHAALSQPGFDESEARAWAAGVTEEAIAHSREVDRKRAKALNRSLVFGLIGGAFVALAALSRLPLVAHAISK